jgi:hypothetical protein
MNMMSVLDLSVFKGKVKAWVKDVPEKYGKSPEQYQKKIDGIERRYDVGDLSGNVKCILCSRGIKKRRKI